jgi:hypothetical protein
MEIRDNLLEPVSNDYEIDDYEILKHTFYKSMDMELLAVLGVLFSIFYFLLSVFCFLFSIIR